MTTTAKIERAEGGVPEWAVKRACELADAEGQPRWNPKKHHPAIWAHARYIAENEEEPVDPLLIEARQIAARIACDLRPLDSRYSDDQIIERYCSGRYDKELSVLSALAALRRGIELAREQGA